MQRAFDIDLLVPIPVGHRAEVRVCRAPNRSTWDGTLKDWNGEPQPLEPIVRDLDTNITYGADWQFREAYDGGSALTEPLLQLVVVEQVVGRVIACRVMRVSAGDGRWATRLIIQVEETKTAYR